MRRAQSFSTKRAASSAGRMARPMSWGTIAGACWAQSLRSSGTKPRAYCSGKSRLIICDAEPACQWIDVDLLHSAMLLTDERRSEEHTSELQSLMRISYAGFCLKKKNKHIVQNVS